MIVKEFPSPGNQPAWETFKQNRQAFATNGKQIVLQDIYNDPKKMLYQILKETKLPLLDPEVMVDKYCSPVKEEMKY